MKEHKDEFDEFLTEEFKKSAEKEEESIRSDESLCMPEGVKEALRARIEAQIQEMEREKVLSQLSEEDRHALELGREMLKAQEETVAEESGGADKSKRAESVSDNAENGRKKVRRICGKRSWKLYVALVAALVLVMAFGMTSIGGPERIVRLMKQAVGDREVEQTDSSDENLVIVEHDEEKAYEEIKDAWGVEPVRISIVPEGMKFDRLELDKINQVGELIYKYNDMTIIYMINASFSDSSWGVDVEDKIVDTYTKEISECSIEVKTYEVLKNKELRFSARFQYKGLEYFFLGTMDQKDFDIIIKNLFFP